MSGKMRSTPDRGPTRLTPVQLGDGPSVGPRPNSGHDVPTPERAPTLLAAHAHDPAIHLGAGPGGAQANTPERRAEQAALALWQSPTMQPGLGPGGAVANTPERRSQVETEAEDRAYELSQDPANEHVLEHLINPATGASYTDQELQVAIRNGHLRDELRNGELGQTPYNLAQQTNSHNSYVPSLHPSVTQQHEEFGLHAFELDIHRGDPGKEFHLPFFSEPVIGSEERVDGDWYVHHDSSPVPIGPVLHATGSDTHNRFLSDGLEEVADLDNVAPVTLFIDLKGNTFTDEGEHTTNDLDAILEEQLADKLYTPQDWIDSVPGAETLEDALRIGGWPTMDDLEGRVLVVLTGGNDQLNEYAGGAEGAGSRTAFIAPSPDTEGGPRDYLPDWGTDDLTHVPNPAAVFYNTNNPDHIPLIHEGGYASRLWDIGNDEEAFATARENGTTVLGTDYVDPALYPHSDSSDPERDIPSFTIIPPSQANRPN